MKKDNTLMLVFLVFILINPLSTKNLKKQSNDEFIKQVFPNPANSNCLQEIAANQIGGYQQKLKSGGKTNARNFSWIKNWGYGQSSYLFDFLDPLIGDLFVKESKKIYEFLMKFDSLEYKAYNDPNLTVVLDPKTGEKRSELDPAVMQRYVKEVYDKSLNTVQIKQTLERYKWAHNQFAKDPALDFVDAYDINGDTRLSPRELILAIINTNRDNYDYGTCSLCLETIVPIIDSIFTYIDCDFDNSITVENMLKYLPKLKRGSVKWDIFSNIDLGVRQKSINDFILQNQKSLNGSLNKQEFRMGILYGFWNRQTTNTAILEDDSQSLKSLRWASDGLVDKEIERYKYQLYLKAEKEKELSKNKGELVVENK